ncbi:putative fasciclin-like arabinogalactan protein 20 [Papaver somniferum]|uniref:putative fasciclin-like arabinogalactan protein 20 n=1 Tax=Papaver somniferum TaxID=3469 RepID=UPI000E7009CC|nr:putative fasciclin-like arabinogalactan protein 20 [Papaver somniferum]
MASFFLASLILFTLFPLSVPILPSEVITTAIETLSSLGFVSMSLTLSLVAQTLIFPSPTATIFAPSDIAFIDSGQPNLNLLQYHFSPLKFTIKSLKSLPYGTKIPTLIPNRTLIVTTSPGETDQISINNVRINDSAVLDIGFLTIFAIDRFFDPSFEDFFTLQLSPAPSPKFDLGCKNPFPDDVSSYSNSSMANVTSSVMRLLGYSVMASFLDLQLPDPTRKLTVFAPTDAVLDPFSMIFSSSSVFHRHFLPCKLTASDMLNLVLYGEITVPKLYEGFTVTFTVVGDVLLVNDVPLLYPDIYVSDSIAVHGIQQILTLPIGSLFEEFHGKDTSPTPSPSITQQPIVLAFPAAQTVITDSVSSKDFDSINGGFHGKDTSPSPPSSITKQPIAAAAIPAGQTVMIDSESSSDNSMFDDYHGKNTNDYD